MSRKSDMFKVTLYASGLMHKLQVHPLLTFVPTPELNTVTLHFYSTTTLSVMHDYY